MDIPLLYGEGFKPKYEYLVNRLATKNTSGLIILHGEPGTGKTMLLRHVISITKRKRFIFLPSDLAKELASPELIRFLYDYEDSVIIIEEAENILRARNDGSRNNAIANILNITDGLMKDFLHFQIICTFNCKLTDIDPALLRPGRLILEHCFNPLPPEQARKVAEQHNLNIPITGPMTLADIFNGATEVETRSTLDRTPIGFLNNKTLI